MKGRSGMKPSDALAASALVARSWPLMTTRPDVGLSSPAMIRIVVVLPAPFGPRNPWISPGATSRLTPSTAVKAPYLFTRFSTRIIALPRRPRPAAPASAIPARERDVHRPHVGCGTADEHGRGAGRDLEVEDLQPSPADHGEDQRLPLEPAARQPEVGHVGGELVEGGVDRHPRPAAPLLDVDLGPAVIVEGAVTVDEADGDPSRDAQRAGHR